MGELYLPAVVIDPVGAYRCGVLADLRRRASSTGIPTDRDIVVGDISH